MANVFFSLQDGIVKDGLWDVYNQIHMVCNDVHSKTMTTYMNHAFLASVLIGF